ncbi:MAG TPA: rRNA maturation RNase YbeY [Gaiellales bacterium]|nr:rRNA maturation RNase YbeY [Gaiellales bacterium]
MTVHVELENRSGHAVDEAAARAAVAATFRAEGVTSGEVGVVLVGAGEMAALNAAHRGKDEPTDVLSFPLDGRDSLPDGLPRQLGDVVVCPERAEADGTPIALLLVHGALHLVGYDHEADNGDMLRRQEAIVEGIGPVAAVRPS